MPRDRSFSLSSTATLPAAAAYNAAFGAEARPQVVNIQTSILTKTVVLNRGAVTRVEIFVKPGEDINFSSFLPCVQPNEIQVGNPDTRKLCWGISNIEVTQ